MKRTSNFQEIGTAPQDGTYVTLLLRDQLGIYEGGKPRRFADGLWLNRASVALPQGTEAIGWRPFDGGGP